MSPTLGAALVAVAAGIHTKFGSRCARELGAAVIADAGRDHFDREIGALKEASRPTQADAAQEFDGRRPKAEWNCAAKLERHIRRVGPERQGVSTRAWPPNTTGQQRSGA